MPKLTYTWEDRFEDVAKQGFKAEEFKEKDTAYTWEAQVAPKEKDTAYTWEAQVAPEESERIVTEPKYLPPEREKPEIGLLSKIAMIPELGMRGLAAGTVRGIKGIPELAEFALSDVLGIEAVEKITRPAIEYLEEEYRRIAPPEELGGLGDIRWWAFHLPEVATTMAAVLLGGKGAGAIAKAAKYGKAIKAAKAAGDTEKVTELTKELGKVVKAGTVAAGMGLEATGARERVRAFEEREGKELDWGQKIVVIAGTGTVAGSLDAISVMKVFGGPTGRRLIDRVLKSMAWEGGTEGAQEIVANAFQKFGYDPSQELTEGVVESIALGAAIGGFAGPIGKGVERPPQTAFERMMGIQPLTTTGHGTSLVATKEAEIKDIVTKEAQAKEQIESFVAEQTEAQRLAEMEVQNAEAQRREAEARQREIERVIPEEAMPPPRPTIPGVKPEIEKPTGEVNLQEVKAKIEEAKRNNTTPKLTDQERIALAREWEDRESKKIEEHRKTLKEGLTFDEHAVIDEQTLTQVVNDIAAGNWTEVNRSIRDAIKNRGFDYQRLNSDLGNLATAKGATPEQIAKLHEITKKIDRTVKPVAIPGVRPIKKGIITKEGNVQWHNWINSKGYFKGDFYKEDLFGKGGAIEDNKLLRLVRRTPKEGKEGFGFDQLTQMAHAEGLIPNAKPETLLEAIRRKDYKPIAMKEEAVEKELKEKVRGKIEVDPSILKQGDQILIDGEVYEHKGIDEKTGDIIIENDKLYKLDIGDKILVDRLLPMELPLGAEKEALKGKIPTEALPETAIERAAREAEARKAEAEMAERQIRIPEPPLEIPAKAKPKKPLIPGIQPTISLNTIIKEGRKEITKSELKHLYDVKSGRKTAKDMEVYLKTKGITVVKEEPVEYVARLEAGTLEETTKESIETAFGSVEKAEKIRYHTAKAVEKAHTKRTGQTFEESVEKYKSEIAKEYANKGRIDFTGRTLTTGKEASDLADMMYVYRSPKQEILHTVLTDEKGAVIAHNAITSGMIEYLVLGDTARYIENIKNSVKRAGATKIHFVHNHPSGNPELSRNDISFANMLYERLGNLIGEFVVIDGKEFSYYDVKRLRRRDSYSINPEHSKWLEERLSLKSPNDIASFAKAIEFSDKQVIFVYADARNQINGWSVHNKNILNKPFEQIKKILTQQAKAHNTTRVAIIASDMGQISNIIMNASKIKSPLGDWVLDILDSEGTSYKELNPDLWRRSGDLMRKWGLWEKGAKYAPEGVGRSIKDMYDRTLKTKEKRHKITLESIRKGFVKGVVDVAGNFRREAMKQGDLGKEVMMRRDVIAGATSKATRMIEDAASKIFAKLPQNQKEILNRIIQSKRTIQIDEYITDIENIKDATDIKRLFPELEITQGKTKEGNYRTYAYEANEKISEAESSDSQAEAFKMLAASLMDLKYTPQGIKHPEGLGEAEHQHYLDNLSTIEGIDAVDVKNLNDRSEIYFNVMRENLKQMYDAGLIDKATYDKLITFKYSPRKFFHYLDPTRTYSIQGKTITVPDSGLKQLKEGSEELLFNDAELLMSEVISRTQGRIFRNNANKALFKLATEKVDNEIVKEAEIVGKTEDGKLIYQKAPAGFQKISVMIDGQKKEMIMPSEMAQDWVTSSPLIQSTLAETINWVSGAKFLKAAATGYNPAFALSNMPRDIGLIWISQTEYSSFLPKAMFEIAQDLGKVASDVFRRKGRVIDYFNEGGGMDFLTHYGRFPGKGKLGTKLQQVGNIMGWVGETSELWTRTALRERAIRNGKSPFEATWIARSYLDFSQGGQVIKAIDLGVPYLNASVQATRSIFRGAKTNPKLLTWKIAQLGALSVLVYLANRDENPEALEAIPDRVKVSNFVITTPYYYIDKNGEKRYYYFKIAKDQGQRIATTFFEGLMTKYHEGKFPYTQVWQAFSDFADVCPTRLIPPTMAAFIGYIGNKDMWMNQDVWKGPKVIPKEEYTRRTNPLAVAIGQATGLSPERMEYMSTRLLAYGNPFVGLVGGGINRILGIMPENQRNKAMTQMLAENPSIRRVFSSTDPYAKYREPMEKAREVETTRRYIQSRKLDEIVQKYIQKQAPVSEIKNYIKNQLKEDQKRLKQRAQKSINMIGVTDRLWWLNLSELPPETRALVFFSRYKNATETEKKRLKTDAHKVEGVLSPRFIQEINELSREERIVIGPFGIKETRKMPTHLFL